MKKEHEKKQKPERLFRLRRNLLCMLLCCLGIGISGNVIAWQTMSLHLEKVGIIRDIQ